MKYILAALAVLSLVGCGDYEQTQKALKLADRAVNLAEESLQAATYWHDKYCSTTEGQTDTECHEDPGATDQKGTAL